MWIAFRPVVDTGSKPSSGGRIILECRRSVLIGQTSTDDSLQCSSVVTSSKRATIGPTAVVKLNGRYGRVGRLVGTVGSALR